MDEEQDVGEAILAQRDPPSASFYISGRKLAAGVTLVALGCCALVSSSKSALLHTDHLANEVNELFAAPAHVCTPCGRSKWMAGNTSNMTCCHAFCYKGYYWTKWGSTIDCTVKPNCFLNRTYYKEVSGALGMPGTVKSVAKSIYECQGRCAYTRGCSHFSYWSDGGCHLYSYTAYPQQLEVNVEHLGVMSGPKDCASVLLEGAAEYGPQLTHLIPATDLPVWAPKDITGCNGIHNSYVLDWKAAKESFFEDFQFITKSETHGAEWYLNKSEAFRLGVVSATDHGAILRVGDQQCPFKRRSVMLHSAQAWRPDKGFMLVMKYKHVPFGAGIWPAFWLVNSDVVWPDGGELDILEYANDDESKVTFHTNKNCSIDQAQFNRCMSGNFRAGTMDDTTVTSCLTNYTGNLLGCKPKQIRRTGKWFSENPGVIATLWDASGVSVYHIPEAEIPDDLSSDKPNPHGWNVWKIAYLPFASTGTCIDLAKPQEIVLNIALCGDWAGGAWWKSKEAHSTQFLPPYCIPGHVTEPATDCCTLFMSSPTSEEYIKQRAYFDIDYIKVFVPEHDRDLPSYAAGTYRNGGKPPAQP
eukprot:TRINITY_DN3630_c0_g1_i2.p1 TRINITY_DN3630_c0_g1~~TRINITY_DN3630_c0_g1_i2.p1  ORF type:complete len:584 (-),score=60.89 TRINITY_DN3630_c0_g1_i2:277-2028(-)